MELIWKGDAALGELRMYLNFECEKVAKFHAILPFNLTKFFAFCVTSGQDSYKVIKIHKMYWWRRILAMLSKQ